MTCGGIGYSTEPGRQAHTGSGGLRYAAKILYEIMLAGFLCLTKPAFMRRPWRITPCPAVHGWAFLCFVGIISTVSRQLRYSPSRACVCLPPGFLTLWLYLPSCRFALGCCRGLALCVFVIACYFLRFALGRCRGLAWICPLFARVCSGLMKIQASYLAKYEQVSTLAQHHIECHHEAEAHHKCHGGAV